MTRTTIRFTHRQGWREGWRKKHQRHQAHLIRLGLKKEE